MGLGFVDKAGINHPSVARPLTEKLVVGVLIKLSHFDWESFSQKPVSDVTVTSNATRLIEYNDTVTLTCFARGTAVSYLWLKENRPIIPGGRFELGADNSTLAVSGVLRTDGSFTCRASNSINSLTSNPLYLDVYCAELNWQLNGVHLQSGQLLILDNTSASQTGNYTCEAYNMFTMRNSASTKEIKVFEPVTGVTVVAYDSTPLENLDTIALSCDASGTVETRTWFKDNQPIQENERMFISTNKAKLIIISVNRNDAGTYKCIASNSFSKKVRILPEHPVVSNIVSNLTLTCFALSVPWGAYAWYNRNDLLHTGQELTLVSMSSVNVGSYTCRVTNGVTNRNSNLTVHVTTRAPKACDNIPLTPGAIVGIVLGLLGVGLIGGASGWFIARKTGGIKNAPQSQYETTINSGRKSTSDTKTVNAPRTYENFPSNEQELNLGDRSVYSDLRR
ncbi:carcinoembryonic antigen-related cell adhesion molecule 5-like [Mobula hypostoma]|uniref:carcinoembryonic antigen-related cell adhesion molecule 5-like n=1 Tax=Mobula hypostoma TaxID=723540 RepID=UPI002FC2D035